MLLNDFYTCQDVVQSHTEFSCVAIFNAGHDIFKGHFPGHPVVPGVCMMEMVKELVQRQVGKSLMLRSAGNVKFLQLITPDSQPLISISWKENESGYSVNASFRSDASFLFKLDGKYVAL